MSAIAGLETGASYPAVRDSDVLAQTIPVPPLDEQVGIARVLNTIRDAFLGEHESERCTTELKASATHHLFTRGLRGETQKETEIGPVPESWGVAPFEGVREWLQYGTSARCSAEHGTNPVLRIPNVVPGRVDSSDLKYASLQATEVEKYTLTVGDLLFIRTNGVRERLGNVAVYEGDPGSALFASYLIRARLRLDRIVPRFIAHFLSSSAGTAVVSGRATPAADGKYNLNTGAIDSIPIPVPTTLEEQHDIVAILDTIDRKIDLHRHKRAVLDELFKALLHKLMTGEIRVADLDLSALEAGTRAEPTA